MSWIQTYSGKRFYPMDPRPEDIDIKDIAHALSNICRFTGHCADFYSVAEHSYLASFYVPDEDKLAALSGWLTTEDWIKWARGVWDDIRETEVLDGWRGARESDEEKHVCPLQLEVIRRCILLYTNPGEVVLDPFMGIGSTAYVALQNGRNAVGFEIKESYHRQAVANAEKALYKPQMGLFEVV